ncbi:L,D-transpeptidase [Streptomyces monticola]|uniref:L,D-transpeptidase n=1 Tax=Streptomyces monticola TaxID=2666263 RepID=A0ABW2JQZ4_9ACTN
MFVTSPPALRPSLWAPLALTVAGGALATVLGAAPAQAAEAPKRCVVDVAGPYQKEVERLLRLRVDGHQSSAECAAIQAFQRREGISPANGYASGATRYMAVVAQARKKPGVGSRCPVRKRRVACVDLTRQLMWVQKGRKITYGVVPIRTGRPGKETRRGWHQVFRKKKNEISTLYDNTPMPHSQYFSGGQALHGSYSNLFSGPGSAGCINLRPKDAARLWRALGVWDYVYVFGRKPLR